ncbi:RICIN domain-containing protein [Altibacter lentus]|uniref:RICIN domain-containing protein n=1 Tax=Altibacter lentus TaxID=1223410 RepID=UPI001362DA42|nr:RICIN domain-containing protein [Altibacter lentus]
MTVASYGSNNVLTVSENGNIELQPYSREKRVNQIFRLKNVYDPQKNPVFYLQMDTLYVRTLPSGFQLQPYEESIDFLFTGNIVSKEDSTSYQLYRPVTYNEVFTKLSKGDNKAIPTTWIADGTRVFLGEVPAGNVPTTKKIVWKINRSPYVPFNFEASLKELDTIKNRNPADIDITSNYYIASRWNDHVLTFSDSTNTTFIAPNMTEKKGALFLKAFERVNWQQFEFVKQGGSNYAIKNLENGKYLTYDSVSDGNGLALYESDPDTGKNQSFVIQYSWHPGNFVSIRAANANLYLTSLGNGEKQELKMMPPDFSEKQEFDLMKTELYEAIIYNNATAIFDIEPLYFKYKISARNAGASCKKIKQMHLDFIVFQDNFVRDGDNGYRYTGWNTRNYPDYITQYNTHNCARENEMATYKIYSSGSRKFTFFKVSFIQVDEGVGSYLPMKVVGRPKSYKYREIVGKPLNAPMKLPSCKILCWKSHGAPEPDGMVGLGYLYAKDSETLQKQIAHQAYVVGTVATELAIGFAIPGGAKGARGFAEEVVQFTGEYYVGAAANFVAGSDDNPIMNGVVDNIELEFRKAGLPPGLSNELSRIDPTGFYDIVKAFYFPNCDCDK